jgi:uncharacterized protein YbcI
MAVIPPTLDGLDLTTPFRDAPPTPERAPAGEFNAAVARSVVRIYREFVGRGPTRAHAFFRDDVVVVVMEDVMTRAELSLRRYRPDRVKLLREALHQAMRTDLTAAVERLSGGRVRALMSATDVEHDMASELFVLDRPVSVAPPSTVEANAAQLPGRGAAALTSGASARPEPEVSEPRGGLVVDPDTERHAPGRGGQHEPRPEGDGSTVRGAP